MTKKKLKVLDLFAGTRSVARAAERAGHETFTIEWDEQHEGIDWYADILTITAQDILDRFGKPDVIWASFDCTTYSVAGISHHRRKDEDGNLRPISEKAILADKLHQHCLKLIKELNPTYYFIENPRGGLRKMNFMKDIPRHTTTYCQWGFPYMKATDLFTNHPNPQFKPPCKNGASCHISAPRGSRSGLQGVKGTVDRSRVPDELCDYIIKFAKKGASKIKERHEVWREITPRYEVSNLGKVRSLDGIDAAGRKIKGRVLKQKTSTRGYASLQIGGRDELVHRLVAKAFIPNPENKPQVNHIDGNKLNNNVNNLEWATSSENNKHRYKLNLHNQDGVKNPVSKFTEEDVVSIRNKINQNTPLASIAKEYGVCYGTIYNIKNNKTYKNI